MRLRTSMKRTSALASLAAGAVIAFGTLTACSSGSTDTATPAAPTSSVAAMPAVANFIADMPGAGGTDMTTIALAVEGDKVVGYATNGTNEDAYFVGTQSNGRMDLTSMYADQLTASYDGSTVSGELVMNEDGVQPKKFSAVRVEAPAGMYTARHGVARATYVVKPDRTVVGVMDNSAPGDHKVTDAIEAKDQQFKDQVREMRLDRQMQQAPPMSVGTLSVTMHGQTVMAVPVTGDMAI